DAQDEDAHAGAPDRRPAVLLEHAALGAAGLLALDHRLGDVGVPLCPIIAELLVRASLIHRLRRIIVAVDEPLFVFFLIAGFAQVIEPVFQIVGLVVSTQHQTHYARGRRGPL